ncbi:hypothetical protein BGX38DRAFT_1227302 [Terfezia claveryi]|nr:hypothetical protein BGX38DRAFT_1227302 [Terfezia claveryi]
MMLYPCPLDQLYMYHLDPEPSCNTSISPAWLCHSHIDSGGKYYTHKLNKFLNQEEQDIESLQGMGHRSHLPCP